MLPTLETDSSEQYKRKLHPVDFETKTASAKC